MNVGQAEKFGILTLSKNNHIKTANLDAQILLAFVIRKNREFIITHNEAKVTDSQLKIYQNLIKKRLKNTPLAYLTGKKDFYGLEFKVNKNTLAPRPETEMIVDEVVNQTKETSSIVIDVGTGTGCIPISIAKNSKNIDLYAIDISKKALEIAKKNAKLHKVEKKIKFLNGNLLKPILNLPALKQSRKSKIIITANLPYLTPAQIKNSPTIQKEPKLALAAGKDGLKYYRQLFKQIKILQVTCSELIVMCEIDPSQKKLIQKLIKKEFDNANLKIKKDLCGKYRLAIIHLQ